MKTLIVGYGSIGSRHARLLSEMNFEVGIVSGREIDQFPNYKSIADAVAGFSPEYVIIANETEKHYGSLAALTACNYKGLVLVEKPLFDGSQSLPANNFRGLYVGFNLRFHPLINKLRTIIASEKIISAHTYVGQYLPNWRPNADYRRTYSANKRLGGGVLRDLSHELDYMNWLLGGWESLTAMGGHFSHLEIDSDDVFSILMTARKCPVATIQLNYIDRLCRREILFNTDRLTIKADLVNATLTIDDRSESYSVTRDYTYLAQHKAIISGESNSLCSIKDGLEVQKMIESAEKAAYSKRWVINA